MRRPTRRLSTAGLAAAAALAAAGTARAQTDAPVVDIEVPAVVMDTSGNEKAAAEDSQLDLANVVQSAAKGVTTVQEAPVIVTVLTGDEIADRQYMSLEEILDTVPGWLRATVVHQFPTTLVRGQVQAVQFLQDGTSLFDPYVNVASTSRVQPIETIKRVEMITGPGGVLWGSNSMVGILNVITKDADDVDGVEVGGTIGGGPGDRNAGRAYMMYGDPDLLHGKAKLFLHGSFETYDGPAYQMASHMFSTPLPQPNSDIIEGPLTTADPPRSYIWNLDGKLTVGKLQIRVQAPFTDRHTPMGFPGDVIRQNYGQDNLVGANGQLACAQTSDQTMLLNDPLCADRNRTARTNTVNYFDRFVVAEYRTRLAHGKAGISVKGYGVQFVRDMSHLQILEGIPSLLPGGLSFAVNATSYRVGAALEGDVETSSKTRLLYGAEAFNEFTINDTTTSRQGAGTQATFIAPYNLTRLPVPCPLTVTSGNVTPIAGCPLTFAFPASRTVLSAYVDPQWRPSKQLILDAGARVAVSPAALGQQSYAATPTFSGTAVYQFLPGWHVKLNFAQGFRPPVFNNIVSNGESVQIDGRADLKVETSTAEQAEINARIFKGDRQIRELSFRADASYTTIHNFIQLVGGRYENTADRGIMSAEFLGKLYIQGGHRIELGYTWLRVNSADKGVIRTMPEHWFNLGGVYNLIDGRLTATTNLRVLGSMEDPNRMVENHDLTYDQYSQVVNATNMQPTLLTIGASELVMDRLPPSADLEIGLTWTVNKKLRVRAAAYNAFNARYFQPDAFGDYQPRLEFQPMPYEDFRAYMSATYQY